MSSAITAFENDSLRRYHINLAWLFRVDGDRRQIFKTFSWRLPRYACIRALEEPFFHRDIHDLRIRGVHREAVDCSVSGQTAHFKPSSEAVRATLESFDSAGVEKNPAHPRRDID